MHWEYDSNLTAIALLSQVVEMYSSGGDLHLELPTGQQGGTKKLWVSAIPFSSHMWSHETNDFLKYTRKDLIPYHLKKYGWLFLNCYFNITFISDIFENWMREWEKSNFWKEQWIKL